MDLKDTYKQLTQIDIDEQRQIWDSRAIGYYGEYLLFCEIYKSLSNNFKALMNLKIPTESGSSTEIDLLLIHETGIYIFECKHYSGIIYGTDTDEKWTQFFKTSPNKSFKNPISQNGYHMRAVKKLYPNVPVYSFIVFTSENCTIKITNNNPSISVCTLEDVTEEIHNIKLESPSKNLLSIDEIDSIFNNLVPFSPMKEKIEADGNVAPFHEWLQPTIAQLEKTKTELEQEKEKQLKLTKSLKSEKFKSTLKTIAVCVCCIIISILVIQGFKSEYNKKVEENTAELASFKQKFKHIDEINNEYIDALNSYVQISEVNILPLTEDAVSFNATLTSLTDTYLIRLTENSKYIVMTDTESVYEYDVFGEHKKYYLYDNTIGKGYRSSGKLATKEFYNISNPNSITYIKLIGIELLKYDYIKSAVIKDNLEIELYKK